MIARRTVLMGIGLSPLAAPVSAAMPSPDDRIEDAIAVIRDALVEKYGWQVNVRNTVRSAVFSERRETTGQVILIDAAGNVRNGTCVINWYADYVGPRMQRPDE